MKRLTSLTLLVFLASGWAADAQPSNESTDRKEKKVAWSYFITRDGKVTRTSPTVATEGPDIDRVRGSALKAIRKGNYYPIYYYERSPLEGGTPETRGEAGKPEESGGDGKKKDEEKAAPTKDDGKEEARAEGQGPGKTDAQPPAEPDWPPKEVRSEPKAIYPTEAELEAIRKKVRLYRNSNDYKDRAAAQALRGRLVSRLVPAEGETLTLEEWTKRFEAHIKLNEEFGEALNSVHSNDQLCSRFADSVIAAEKTHAGMFKQLKWYADHAAKLQLDRKYLRTGVFKYMEANPDKFPNDDARKLFCMQILKGGLRDPGVQALADSYK